MELFLKHSLTFLYYACLSSDQNGPLHENRLIIRNKQNRAIPEADHNIISRQVPNVYGSSWGFCRSGKFENSHYELRNVFNFSCAKWGLHHMICELQTTSP